VKRLGRICGASVFSVALASLVLASPALAKTRHQEGEFCSGAAYRSTNHGLHRDTGQIGVWISCIYADDGRLRWVQTGAPTQTPNPTPSVTATVKPPVKPPTEAATLPKTGSNTTGVLSGGIALAAIGGGVTYLLRRRRFKFEA
jgi:LPXTG-motif cell wall-anchored protein